MSCLIFSSKYPSKGDSMCSTNNYNSDDDKKIKKKYHSNIKKKINLGVLKNKAIRF